MTSTDKSAAEFCIEWLRNNYQDYANIADLCDAMRAALPPADLGAVAFKVHEEDAMRIHATLYAPVLKEFCLEATRDDESRNWYIEVTDEGGYHTYDGYWRNSEGKTWAEVLAEAVSGSMLDKISAPPEGARPLAAPSIPSASLTTPSKEPAGAVAVPLVAIHLIEDAAQAHDQCRAVVHMALSLAEVYAARAVILSSSANAPIEIIGESSAATMEYLGDLLSSMDAVEEGDAWLDPIFEAAHARWPLAAPGAAIDAREQEVSSRFTTKYPLLNDLLQETWWLGKGPNSMDTGLAWFASLERFLEWLASHPEAPAASAPAAETPTDEAIEDFLAARMTQEGRVPMLRTIREALTHFAAPAAEVAQPVGYEHFAAIREGHRNAAEDAWFQAIPNMEPRRAFQVGFDAGYNTRDAALASSPSSGPSGGNLPPLPSIIPEGTPLAHAFREYARQAVYASSPSSTPAESDTESVAVPLNFLQGFLTLAHNYSLRAEAPDFYDGRAGDAFSDAYRRCGRDLGKLRDMLPAAPQAIQAAGEGGK